jgi:carboxyl-terminal processing protease
MPLRSRLLVVMAVLGSSLLFGGWLLGRGMQGGLASPPNGDRLFDQVLSHIRRNYVDSLTTPELFDKAMNGMLEELGDPHSLYLRADRLKRLNETTSGNYTGLGVQVDIRDGLPTVLSTLPGGPAERSGLQTGDRILELGGRTMRGLTAEEVVGMLRGPVGATLVITIERPGAPTPFSVRVTRGEIHRRAVRRSALMPGGVGYIDVKVFSDSTQQEVASTIDSLTAQGMTSLIVDLRGNLGGLLSQGVGVADLFLDAGKSIVRMRGRIPEANANFSDKTPQRWPHLPLVVLVDEGSASASEIVAGALQDHDRALLVGRTTFGKGSAQSLYPTASGGALKLTTARWFTPSGRSIDRQVQAATPAEDAPAPTRFRTEGGRLIAGGGGIAPDVVVGDTVQSPEELALAGALGKRVSEFRDALTAYALALRASNPPASPAFAVDATMRAGLWREMQTRGLTFDRAVYDAAAPIVNRLIAREVTRFTFGAAAETRRSIADDEAVQAAQRLLVGAASQREVLDRGARLQAAQRAIAVTRADSATRE